jgi:hypothetical protein
MSSGPPRILYENRLWSDDATLAASSEQQMLPVTALLDQLRSDVWRSALGWTIGAENNKIDFNRGGVKVATVASGTYASGVALADAVVDALEAADVGQAWACTYDPVGHTFILSATPDFSLLNITGANRANNCTYDMGFVAVDVSGTNLYTSGVSYQSRHFVHVDFGSAQSFAACLLTNHNSGAGGTYIFQASSSTLIGVGLGSTAPTVNETLDGTGAIRHEYIDSASHRYARIVVADIANADGYNEIGVLFVGPYLELDGFQVADEDEQEHLTELHLAANGANYRSVRQTRRIQSRALRITDPAEKTALEAFDSAVSIGGNFFINDYSDDPATTMYAHKDKGIAFQMLTIGEAGPIWDATIQFRESLG